MKSKRKETRYFRGDLVWVDLGQHPGKHIQSGRKLCLIVSTNKGNRTIFTVMVGTSNLGKSDFPVHVAVTSDKTRGGMSKTTVFMAEQLTTVDKQDIVMKVGCVDTQTDAMDRIKDVLKKQLELEV